MGSAARKQNQIIWIFYFLYFPLFIMETLITNIWLNFAKSISIKSVYSLSLLRVFVWQYQGAVVKVKQLTKDMNRKSLLPAQQALRVCCTFYSVWWKHFLLEVKSEITLLYEYTWTWRLTGTGNVDFFCVCACFVYFSHTHPSNSLDCSRNIISSE